jgi:uncharacterized membrane protein (UPF0127 family)
MELRSNAPSEGVASEPLRRYLCVEANSGIWRSDGGAVLAVERANAWQRLRGLIGRPPLPPASALLFTRCRSLHGLQMTHEIDAVFVDRRLRVLCVRRLRPWRVTGCLRAAHALELLAGECERLGIAAGDGFKLQQIRDRGVRHDRPDG